VKVNAPVDKGIAPLVSALSRVSELETLSSCQGRKRQAEANVYFHLGTWKEICDFAFGRLVPALARIGGWSVSVEVFNGSKPMAKLSCTAEGLPNFTSAVRSAINDRKCGYSHGKGYKAPRS